MSGQISIHDTKSVDLYVGGKIREARIRRGMSQAELAQRIGITYQQAHKYERGVNRTSASRLLLIAGALGVEICDLLPASGATAASRPGRLELELARNFALITNENHRQSVCQLVRALASE